MMLVYLVSLYSFPSYKDHSKSSADRANYNLPWGISSSFFFTAIDTNAKASIGETIKTRHVDADPCGK